MLQSAKDGKSQDIEMIPTREEMITKLEEINTEIQEGHKEHIALLRKSVKMYEEFLEIKNDNEA
jgi:hypothetical protein